MTAPHAEPRQTERQRVEHVVQVDVIHSAAAGQLGITAHVDMEDGKAQRPAPPASLKAAVAAAIQGVVDELMPFPADAEEPAGEKVEA
jgi:hypothetical protein